MPAMVDVVCALVLVAIVAAAAGCLVYQKKRGVTCVGCPHGSQCSGSCGVQAEALEAAVARAEAELAARK